MEQSNYKGNPKNFDPFFHLKRKNSNNNNNKKFPNNGAQQPTDNRFPNNQTYQNYQAQQNQQHSSNQGGSFRNTFGRPVQIPSVPPQPPQQPFAQGSSPFGQFQPFQRQQSSPPQNPFNQPSFTQQPASQSPDPFAQQQHPTNIFGQPQFPPQQQQQQQQQDQDPPYATLALDFLDNLCEEAYRFLVEDSEGDVRMCQCTNPAGVECFHTVARLYTDHLASCAELQYDIVNLLYFMMSQSVKARAIIPQWIDAFEADNPSSALTNIIKSTGHRGLVNLSFGAATSGFGVLVDQNADVADDFMISDDSEDII
jgi:hypothetical protein